MEGKLNNNASRQRLRLDSFRWDARAGRRPDEAVASVKEHERIDNPVGRAVQCRHTGIRLWAASILALSILLLGSCERLFPTTFAAPDLVAQYDTGTSDSDNVTSSAVLVFTGIARPNSNVSLYRDESIEIDNDIAGAGGTWTIQVAVESFVPEGSTSVVDFHGLIRLGATGRTVATDRLSVTIDREKPSPPIITGPVAEAIADGYPVFTWQPGGGGEGTYFVQIMQDQSVVDETETELEMYSPESALIDGTYEYEISERDLAGNWSEPSIDSLTVDTSVGALSNLVADAIGVDIGLSWSLPADNDIEQIEIRWTPPTSHTQPQLLPGTATTATVSELEPITAYAVEVTAVDDLGNRRVHAVSATTSRFTAGSPIATAVSQTEWIDLGDIDGDNDLDLVAAALDSLLLYENTDGQGNYGTGVEIDSADGNRNSVEIADIDGDDDNDILVGSATGATVAWYESTDGSGAFSSAHVIASDGCCPNRFVSTADLDGDGDLDVVASRGSFLEWYRNTDGLGSFVLVGEIESFISSGSLYPNTADLDGDGDMDVLLSTATSMASEDKVSWYENADSGGSFSTGASVKTGADFTRLEAVRVDGDADLDLAVIEQSAGLMWFENTDGNGSFSQESVISENASGQVLAADFDGDGDEDLVASADSTHGDVRVSWYENRDDADAFLPPKPLSGPIPYAVAIEVGDVDGDGDVDVIVVYSRKDIYLHRNLTIQ
jgi:hypothetical protein